MRTGAKGESSAPGEEMLESTSPPKAGGPKATRGPNEEAPDRETAQDTAPAMDDTEEHAKASAGSGSSRISIRIPRKAVSSSGTTSGTASQASSAETSTSHGETLSRGDGAEEEGEGEDAGVGMGVRSRRGRPRKLVRGRKRRGRDDSEESAYSESDASEESTESEEVYSEEEDDEDEEEEEEDEEETDEDTEVWDSRRGKYVKKEPHRSTVPPMSIPFQYASVRMPYPPLAPLPPGAAAIPMFQNYNPRPIAPAGAPPVMPGTTSLPFTQSQLDALASNTLNLMLAKAVGGAERKEGEVASAPAPPASGEKPEEKKADNPLSPLPVSPLSPPPPLPPHLNPNPNPSPNPHHPPLSLNAAAVRPPGEKGPAASPELKNALHALMASQEWRAALLAKLQMNRNISAEQAAKLGLRPAAPPVIPPMSMTMPPQMRMPMPLMRPMMPMSYYQAPPRPKPPKQKKKKVAAKPAVALGEEGENTPIAARRERRTPRKSVDYSKFFQDDVEDDDDDEEEDEEETDDGGGASDSGPEREQRRRRPVERKPKGLATPRKRPATPQNGEYAEEDYDEFEGDDDEEGGLRGSNSSDDVGVEKILSHRVNPEGQEEFLVKFHNMSYVHAEWISEEEMLAESNGSSRIKRFLSKPLSLRHFSDKHPFNPEFTAIDRIVHGWDHPDENDPTIKTSSYLVKWCALPYCEATWEKKATLLALPDGPDKLAEFARRPSLELRRMTSKPLGWRPERAEHQNMTDSPEYKNGNTLRPYQLEGLNWLLYCWTNRQSCIIADEMGLGKTVQSVAFSNFIYTRYNVRGPFLIIAPLSTIPHWEREFEAWTDLNVITYHGNIPSRDLMNEYEFYYRTDDDKIVPDYYKFDVLITTYEMALAGFEHLQPITWRVAIFDEAHRLKNRASKASETLKALQIEHKVLLTGTPLQNNIEELWSLLNFLQPHRFFSESQFKSEYGNLQRSEDVIRLQELLKPLMLRRLKEDVEKSIPVKEETVIEVELTSVQKRYYRAILERNFAFLTKGCRGANAPNLINAMMELRKCCIHPYLIKGAEERIVAECGASSFEEQMHCMVQASGKLVLVDKLLKRLRENGHRVLVFSQMTRCLDLLVDYLKWREYPFERIDGAIKGELRQAAIDRFCDPTSDSFVFLLCTRAGGVGINLTAADTVVIFDSDWNPQNDIQAQARCHRIGQTKSVKVYRLLTRNTYEREMFDKAGLKLGLDRAVLRKILPDETLEGATHNPQLSKKEVETLLKKGAYGLLMENDEDSIRFCEEDIDQILARRTTVIRHEGVEARTAEGGSIFSKASFAATADDMDIDIDDPNFWELWARRLDLDPRQLLSSSGVVVDEPRIKRQARRLKGEELNLDGLDRVLEELATERDAEGDAPNKTKGRPPPQGSVRPGEPQLWTAEERSRFITELLRIGIHRYEEMLPLFPGRTKNDLIACTRAVVKLCLEAVEGDDDARLREDNEKLLLAHLDFDRSAMDGEAVDGATGKIDLAAAEIETEEPPEPIMATKDFARADIPFSGASRRQIYEYRSFLRQAPARLIEELSARARPILLRLQLLDFIRQLVEGHATVTKKSRPKRGEAAEETEYHLPVPNIVGAAPVRGWGKLEDEFLVIGVYRLGFGRYEDIKNDPTLPFSGMNWAKSGAVEADKNRTTDAEADADKDQDQDKGQGANAEEATKGESWPSREALDERLKKVVLAMEKRTQAAAKLAIQAMNASEQTGRRRKNVFGEEDDEMYEEEYQPPTEERRRQSRGTRDSFKTNEGLGTRWSKRDRGEFQRVVMHYGLPEEGRGGRRDWSTFKELGDFAGTILKAGDRAFDEYCELFVKGCKAVTEKRSTRKPSKTGIVDDDYIDDDVAEGGEGDEGDEDERRTRGTALPLIPVERAKKALSRIEMLGRLRSQVLPLPDLEGCLERSRKTSGLPQWWETPQHDMALLRGVGTHGLGRGDLIVMDVEGPFRAIYEAADPEAFADAASPSTAGATAAPDPHPPRRGRKKKVVALKGTPSGVQPDLSKIDWPNEATLTRRVEMLIEMASNEAKRRARAAEETETHDADNVPVGKRRRTTKGKQAASTESATDVATETTMTTTASPPRRRRNTRQRSILDYATSGQQ